MTSPLRAAVFVDGQNLYNSAKKAFGYEVPNYDVRKLAQAVCDRQGWALKKVKFYTGYFSAKERPRQHGFWMARLRAMRNDNVDVFARPVKYGKEKGVDVRIALDVVRAIYENECDVVVIFSCDQDFSEVAKEAQYIARRARREIIVASAYPHGKDAAAYGINKTKWLPMNRQFYDSCLDKRNYYPPRR